MRADFNAGKVVILNVHNGNHWVLTTGVSGTNFSVNDPGFNTGSYPQSEVVRAGIFRRGGAMSDEEIADALKNLTPSDVAEEV